MGSRTGRLIAAALAGAIVGGLAAPAPALAQQQTRSFAIPAQDLAGAIEQFSRQSGRQVLFDRDHAIGGRSSPVKGDFPPEQALRRLLKGTGLDFQSVNDKTIVIKSRAARSSRAAMLQAPPAQTAALPPPETETGEDIIVTAFKREERLIDVPVPVATISASALVDSNSMRVQDYYQRIPGLSLVTSGNGNEPAIAIRGVTTGGMENPTVGIVVDDVPFGPSITVSVVPDIDPSNLSRVEVLRGPQGSLYGASSMGGLIKFVTVEPSTSRLKGSVQAGISGVDRGGDAGYSLRGDVNIPLGDTLAVRTSAYYRRDPGYVDNVTTGRDDVNEIRAKGVHASLLWKPSSIFSVRLSALLQESRRAASDEINLGIDTAHFSQNDLPFTGSYRQRVEVYSGVIKAELGKVDLTSITAYNYSDMASMLDVTPVFDGVYAGLSTMFFGVPSSKLPYFTRTKVFTQELRANVPLGPNINWLIGGLLDHETLTLGNEIQAFDTATGKAFGNIVSNTISQKYRNYALFSNLDVTLSDQVSVQLGGRFSTNRQRSRTLRAGPLIDFLFGAPTVDSGVLKSNESPFTFSIAPQWKIRPDLMAYARVASGYRPGGPNINCGNPNVACTYGSDSTVNYEIGLKGDFLDRLLTVDASLYLIDWKDIQTLVITADGSSGYTANGTRARSKGVELSLGLRPARKTRIDAWIAYNDSTLSEDFPAAAGLAAFKGDRLPSSARWSGNVSANQDFALGDGLNASVGGNLSYVGKRTGSFQPGPTRSIFPDYWQLDLTAGLNWEDWRLNAFVTNVTNTRGVLRSGLDSNLPTLITYIRPRSFGLSLTRSF